MSDVFCNNCGSPIEGELLSGDPAQQKPCPKCGSMARTLDVIVKDQIGAGDSATAKVIPYAEILLSTARDLIDRGDCSLAVVVAHTPCEISTERALSWLLAGKGLSALEKAVEDLLGGYSLANSRVQNFYNALSGVEVQKQPFWQAFKESVTRRNRIIHKGLTVNKADAEASYKAACDVVAYLK